MENTPTIYDIVGLGRQVEQISGLRRPTLPDIEPRQKLACRSDAVWVYINPMDVATSRRKIGVLRRGNQQCDATQIAPG